MTSNSDSRGGDLTQWQLIRRRFVRHRLAVASFYFILLLYLLALFAEFFAPYPTTARNLGVTYCPPQFVRFSFDRGFHTFVLKRHIDPITFKKSYVEERDNTLPLRFFAKGAPYKLCGFIPWDRHFIGVDLDALGEEIHKPAVTEGRDIRPEFFLLGADRYGRDLFSRIIHGARISLSVGLIGIGLTFVLGLTVGGVSGYLGGAVDTFIQRVIEIVSSFPHLPLWLALAAVMPPDWSPLRVYFAITIVLSLLGWTGLARVVRGKLLALREEDYVTSARLLGASHGRIILRHLLPGFTSHIIVALTMSVPTMILGETSLSFLGLGLRPPIVSWGVMLQDCMNMTVVANYPWLLLPVVFIIITVLSFNFLGDGLRDAADPYGAH